MDRHTDKWIDSDLIHVPSTFALQFLYGFCRIGIYWHPPILPPVSKKMTSETQVLGERITSPSWFHSMLKSFKLLSPKLKKKAVPHLPLNHGLESLQIADFLDMLGMMEKIDSKVEYQLGANMDPALSSL